MFAGSSETVTFRMKKYLIDDVIDWFGTDVQFSDGDEEAVTARVRVNLQAMRRWAVQYAPHVRVLSPESLAETVKQDIRSAAKEYELFPEQNESARECNHSLQNLNAPIRDEERMTVEETIADTGALSPEQRALKTEVLIELYSAMDQLPQRERNYVLFRYGFLDSEDHTLTETARHFHLSESRARGIEETALAHLRDSICSMKTRNPNPLPTGFKFGFLQYGRVEQKRYQGKL